MAGSGYQLFPPGARVYPAGTINLADGSVTRDKLANLVVAAPQLDEGAVGTSKLGFGAVSLEKAAGIFGNLSPGSPAEAEDWHGQALFHRGRVDQSGTAVVLPGGWSVASISPGGSDGYEVEHTFDQTVDYLVFIQAPSTTSFVVWTVTREFSGGQGSFSVFFQDLDGNYVTVDWSFLAVVVGNT